MTSNNHQEISSWDRHQPKLLRLAVALCFFCHGIWAIKCASLYHSEWNVWIQNLLAFLPKPMLAAQVFLTTIGVIDIVAALALIIPKPPALAYLWVIAWGTATAFSRIYFLSSLQIDLLQGIIYPLTHTMVRVANFSIPFLTWRVLQGTHYRGIKLPSPRQIYVFVVSASAIAIALRYVVMYYGPEYPYKLYAMGQSLWVFHAAGTLAWLAVAGLMISPFISNALSQRLIALTILSSFLTAELITLGFLYAPHGLIYVMIKLGERATVYMAVIGWVITHHALKLNRSSKKTTTAAAITVQNA